MSQIPMIFTRIAGLLFAMICFLIGIALIIIAIFIRIPIGSDFIVKPLYVGLISIFPFWGCQHGIMVFFGKTKLLPSRKVPVKSGTRKGPVSKLMDMTLVYDSISVNGLVYNKIKPPKNGAICLGCRKIEFNEALFNNQSSDSFYHGKCLIKASRNKIGSTISCKIAKDKISSNGPDVLLSSFRVCKSCNMTVEPKAKFCRNCGNNLS